MIGAATALLLALLAAAAGQVTLLGSRLRLTCDGSEPPLCMAELSAEINNGVDAVAEVELGLPGEWREVMVSIDGKARLDVGGRVSVPPGTHHIERTSFVRARVVDRCVRPDPVSAAEVRHSILGSSRGPVRYRVGGMGTVVRVQHAPGWTVLMDGMLLERGPHTMTFESQHGVVELEPPSRVFDRGGLLLGVGADLRAELAVRAGYEVVLLGAILAGATVETNSLGEVHLAPTLAAASAGGGYLPSISAGLGAAVEVEPHRRIAPRLRFDLQWLYAGVGVTVDFVPGLRDLPAERRTIVWLQLSL